MKRISLFLTVMLLASHIQGQITLTMENTPHAENEYFYFQATNSNITFDTIGLNINWDMSYLSLSDDTTCLYYTKDTNFNPFPEMGDEFPFDDFCDSSKYNLRSLGALYNIEENRFSLAYELATVKSDGTEFEMTCFVDKTILEFPFSYNDSIASGWNSYDVDTAFKITKSKSYGTLNLPNDNFSSVLLVHTYEKVTKTPYPPGPHALYDTLIYNRYHWYDSAHDLPLLKVTYKERRWHEEGSKYTNFSYDTTAFVFSHQNNLLGNVEYSIDNTDIKIFPNPAKDRVFISVNKDYKDLRMQLYDLSGKMMMSFKSSNVLTNGNIILETENIPKGLYILQVSTPFETILNEKLMIN